MNDLSILQSSLRTRLRSLSIGIKLVVICILALFMTIPAFFVSDLVHERTQRASDVVKEISSHVGGQQTFLGPTLAVSSGSSTSSSISCSASRTTLSSSAQSPASLLWHRRCISRAASTGIARCRQRAMHLSQQTNPSEGFSSLTDP
jgi:inner membrane protein